MAKHPAETPTEVVPLAGGQPVSWLVNRKVWLGASVATLATAATGVLMWALNSFAGIDIPAEIGAQIALLMGGLLATAAYFIQAYFVIEPPTLPRAERVLREVIAGDSVSKKQADEILTKANVKPKSRKKMTERDGDRH